MAQIVVTVGNLGRVSGYAYTPTADLAAEAGSTQNKAGTAWETAIVDYLNQSRHNGTEARFVGLPAAYQTALDSGTWFEWSFTVSFPVGATDAEKLATLKADVNDQEADMIQKMIERLQYWGFRVDTSS